MKHFYEQVYELVRQVPCGKVVTYGQVAALLGSPRSARAVGYALRYLPRGTDVRLRAVATGHQSQRGDQPALSSGEPTHPAGAAGT